MSYEGPLAMRRRQNGNLQWPQRINGGLLALCAANYVVQTNAVIIVSNN